MTAGCTEDKKIWDSKADEKLEPISLRQLEVLYFPWERSHSLKWILYGYFFQTRITLLIVYLQNAVQFNKAREIQRGE